ncbi:unannotated protein [freshwater metagenome]
MTASISSRGMARRRPSVAQTTALLGPRPVANAFGCSLGAIATRGIGRFARVASEAIMS